MKWLPNLFTLVNLCCGSFAVFLVYTDQLNWVLYLFTVSLLADFFDGFLARRLKAQSAVGKVLDSLADVVSFGVLPSSVFLFHLGLLAEMGWQMGFEIVAFFYLIAAALRLARFSVNTDQIHGFSGLPSPAAAIAVMGFFLGSWNEVAMNTTYLILLICIGLVTAVLMLSSLPMYKIGLQFNWSIAILILVTALFVILLGTPGFTVGVVCYIILSLVLRIQSN